MLKDYKVCLPENTSDSFFQEEYLGQSIQEWIK